MYYAGELEIEKLDILAVENGLEIRQMMELAGWHMVNVFRKLKIPKSAKVIVVCGKGNKGGDGLSAARHLINNGWGSIRVILLSKNISKDPKHHLNLLEKMEVPIFLYPEGKKELSAAGVIIDSLIGYHLRGAPRGVFAEAIELMNESEAKIVSFDIPSGIDSTTGECFEPCIKANSTLTLALPKKAFLKNKAKKLSGKIFLGDIGIPDFIYNKVSKGSRPPFKSSRNGLLFL